MQQEEAELLRANIIGLGETLAELDALPADDAALPNGEGQGSLLPESLRHPVTANGICSDCMLAKQFLCRPGPWRPSGCAGQGLQLLSCWMQMSAAMLRRGHGGWRGGRAAAWR